jgi:hypothetical protein
MAESRNAPRTAAKQRGIAVLGGTRSEVNCTIRDLSATGARLSFMNPTILPRQFHLRWDDQDQRVTVMWQGGLLAGVRFQTSIKGLAAARKKKWPWSKR